MKIYDFVATTPANRVGLWKTDGTAAGAALVYAFGTFNQNRF